MLALASFPEHDVIEQMLLAATAEPRLRHDFLAAVDQIGTPAAQVMVEHLRAPTSDEPDRERRLAAEAVGLVGEIEAASSLERCLLEDDDELRIAALHALGALGSPSSLIAVTAQLGDDSPEVRQAAVVAAGQIGGPSALLLLEIGLGDDDVEVARAAAGALRRSGERGQRVLGASEAPVAREALALAALGSPA
jgi:HEAT repeat protein